MANVAVVEKSARCHTSHLQCHVSSIALEACRTILLVLRRLLGCALWHVLVLTMQNCTSEKHDAVVLPTFPSCCTAHAKLDPSLVLNPQPWCTPPPLPTPPHLAGAELVVEDDGLHVQCPHRPRHLRHLAATDVGRVVGCLQDLVRASDHLATGRGSKAVHLFQRGKMAGGA